MDIKQLITDVYKRQLLEGVVCVGKPACQINTMAVRRLVWLNEQEIGRAHV